MAERVIYTYDLPEVLAKEVGVASIGVVQLTANDELMATRRAAGDAIRLGMELPKQALAEVDGVAVNTGDASADQAFEKLGPVGRQLLVAAYVELNRPAEAAIEGFRKSKRVSVG